MIVSAAIKLVDSRVFVGNNHSACFKNLIDLYRKAGVEWEVVQKLHIDCIQGFINDSLQFLTREEAYYEAFNYNQCSEQKWNENYTKIKGIEIVKENWHPCLFSEHIW